jgi:hypothetical protein
MRQLLLDDAGKVIGACDSMPFDILGRRRYRPRARPVVAATDTNVEMPTLTHVSTIKGYDRLR